MADAPSPHGIDSAHHTGTISDTQAPQFLKTDGSRQLLANLAVSPNVTIDGVDISVLKNNYDAHLGDSLSHTYVRNVVDDVSAVLGRVTGTNDIRIYGADGVSVASTATGLRISGAGVTGSGTGSSFLGIRDNAGVAAMPNGAGYLLVSDDGIVNVDAVVANTLSFSINQSLIQHSSIGGKGADDHHAAFIGLVVGGVTVEPSVTDKITIAAASTAVAITQSASTVTVGITPANILLDTLGGSLSWANVSKVGSSLADLAVRSHALLSDSGTNTHAQIDTHLASTSNPHTVTKAQVGLSLVENTALSTWAGTTNVVTLGSVVTGTWSASTIALVKGGTGATTGLAARANLGLTIGTHVQAWDADLDVIAALAKADSNFIVGNGTAWVVESGATARASLGLTIGTNVQAWDTDLDTIAALAKTDSNIIVGNGTAWVAESGATARASLGLGLGDSPGFTGLTLTGILNHGNDSKSTIYTSGSVGWLISTAGAADFRSIEADKLHAKSFISDLEQALVGGQIITKSVAVLSRNFSVPATTGTLYVEDLPGYPELPVFAVGDTVRMVVVSRTTGVSISTAIGTVSAYVNLTGNEQSWTFTKASGTTGGLVYAGAIVLDFGVSGNGFWETTSLGPNAPYAQAATWTTTPDNKTVHVRVGNLAGVGFAEYGIWASNGGTQYFKAGPSGVEMTGTVNILNPGSINTSALNNNAGWTTDATANTAIANAATAQSTANTALTNAATAQTTANASALTAAWGSISSIPARFGNAPAGSGLYLTGTNLGFYNGSAWKTYMDNLGNFYLSGSGSNSLSWNGATLTIAGDGSGVTGISGNNISTGTISADRIGAASITADKLASRIISANYIDVTKPLGSNVFDSSTWRVGTSGSQGSTGESTSYWHAQVGSTIVNSIVNGVGPYGHDVPLWKMSHIVETPSGWSGQVYSGSSIPVDPTKTYRFSVFVKPIGSIDPLRYFGPVPNSSVVVNLNGTASENPYFISGWSSGSSGEWYLLVGYIYPYDWAGTANSSGIYHVASGARVGNGNSYKWISATPGNFRIRFGAYDVDIVQGDETFFCNPRMEIVNGNEVSIDALLGNGVRVGDVSPSLSGLYLSSAEMGYWNGNAWKSHIDSSGNFYLSGSGSDSLTWNGSALTIVGGGTFSGTVSGGAIDIGGADATSFHVDTSGQMWLGNAAYASAPFKVSSAGAMAAISGSIGGVVVGNGKLYTGTGTWGNANTGLYLGSDGKFSLKDKLKWDGTTLLISGGGTFSGTLSAATGSFSGDVTAASLALSGNMTIGTLGKITNAGADYIIDESGISFLAYSAIGLDDTKYVRWYNDLGAEVLRIGTTVGPDIVGGTSLSTSNGEGLSVDSSGYLDLLASGDFTLTAGGFAVMSHSVALNTTLHRDLDVQGFLTARKTIKRYAAGTVDIGTVSNPFNTIYAQNITATTIIGQLTGGEWEFVGDPIIDANGTVNRTVWITNQGTGRADLNVDRNIVVGGTVDGVDIAAHSANTSNPHAVTKAQVGLSAVENTALSTWTGTTSITTLGMIATGTWQGTAIANTYIAGINQNLLTTSAPAFAALTVNGNITVTGTVDGIAVAGHVSATAVHGATGAVVGTENVQVLTNKKMTMSAGVATVGGAPIKFITGVSLTTPEAGTIEFDGTDFYITI